MTGSSGTEFMTLTLTDDDYYLRIGGMTGASSLAVGSSTLALKGVTDCFLLTINAATGDWVGRLIETPLNQGVICFVVQLCSSGFCE